MTSPSLPIVPAIRDPRKETNFLIEYYPYATGETNYLDDQANRWQEWMDHYLHLYYFRNLHYQTALQAPFPLAELNQIKSHWEGLHSCYGFLADPVYENRIVVGVYFSYPSKHRWTYRYSSRIAIDLFNP